MVDETEQGDNLKTISGYGTVFTRKNSDGVGRGSMTPLQSQKKYVSVPKNLQNNQKETIDKIKKDQTETLKKYHANQGKNEFISLSEAREKKFQMNSIVNLKMKKLVISISL